MKRILAVYALLILLLSSAQNNDAGLWTSIAAEKKITQSLSAYLSESFRFNENITQLGGFFTETGIEKKLLKNVGVSLNYRFYHKKNGGDYSLRHRYFIDVSFKEKIGDIAVSYRTRVQSQMENYFLPAEKIYGNTPENYWRNKLSLSYRTSKNYKPFVSAELWYLLNSPARKVDNLRLSGGLQFEFDKRNSIEIYYIIQKELQKKDPRTDFITSLSYTFAF